MSVRFDRWNDVKAQMIPRMLPAGLESIGDGLGVGGQPLQNIGQIASMHLWFISHFELASMFLFFDGRPFFLCKMVLFQIVYVKAHLHCIMSDLRPL